MTAGFGRPTTPFEDLAARLAELQRAVRDLQRPQPFRIPVLAADPPTTDPINIWMFPDGRIRARHWNTSGTAYVTREWVPTAAGSSSSATALASPASAPISHTKVYEATWSQSYSETGAARDGDGGVMLYYGWGDSTYGMNRSLIGFDYSTINTDLASSTVQGVWLRLTNLGSWFPAGADIHFGIHNYTAEPATWSGGGIPSSMATKSHFGQGESKLVALPLDFAVSIRDGWGKGVALESPSESREFYGFAGGYGSGYQLPALVVAYAK